MATGRRPSKFLAVCHIPTPSANSDHNGPNPPWSKFLPTPLVPCNFCSVQIRLLARREIFQNSLPDSAKSSTFYMAIFHDKWTRIYFSRL